ncbi:MAG: hypothetical protein PHQ43_04755 [Dehalococcoidales bacterium]|nr:hypothetical protein [Dehalococcoidales bacterium]
MGNRAKSLLLSGLAVVLVVPLLGCGLINTLVSPAALSTQQAIAIIQIAGIPYIDDYYQEAVEGQGAETPTKISPARPVGQWVADYDGNGNWRIQGTVTTNAWGSCLTTWTLREEDSRIKLIGFNCG